MDNWQLSTPVVLIIFNRPDPTAQVLAEIAKAKPPKLLVIADGPRPNHPTDAERCAQTRAVIEQQVTWDCEVLTNYAETNLGCQRRVASGLDWVFETVPEAIIFEDDCVPHPTFFRFCDELLAKYRDDERVMVISGDNFHFGKRFTEYSYFFSCFSHPTGWASWRRAWQHFDAEMSLWPQVRSSGFLRNYFAKADQERYWANIFQLIYESRDKRNDVWDAQWMFACLLNSGLTIIPSVNLITNIGFNIDATHTVNKWSRFANMDIVPVEFPLKHPPYVSRNALADEYTHAIRFKSKTNLIPQSIKEIAKKFLVRWG